MLRFLTAGESHGESLIAILEGMPSGFLISEEFVNTELARRQSGYGRGARMQIECDTCKFLSGLRKGKTLASPIAMLVKNKDHSIDKLPDITLPRPGHADLAGGIKYDFRDFRNVLERASARETAARVCVGACCKLLINSVNVDIGSHVVSIGDVKTEFETKIPSFQELKNADKSPVRCLDESIARDMMALIDEASDKGDTLGGVIEVIAYNVPPGLGSYVMWDTKIDGRLCGALMSIPAIKAVEIGEGISATECFGSKVHDGISWSQNKGFYRQTNRAGGLEGGITNGEPVVLRAYMKPIATLSASLPSVEVNTKQPDLAAKERHDVCAVPACGVVLEAMMAFIIAQAFLEKFCSDTFKEFEECVYRYRDQVKEF